MKKLMLSFILLGGVAGNALATEYYVAESGNDHNAGTKWKPFASLEVARDAIRKNPKKGGHTVWIRGGRYFFDQTLEFNGQDSGTKARPNVYKAVPGEQVFFDGGKALKASVCSTVTDPKILKRLVPDAKDKIVQIDLKKLGITDFGELGHRGFRRAYIPAPLELFIDNGAQQIARYPNRGEKHIKLGEVLESGSNPRRRNYSMVPATFKYETERAERWTEAEDLYISGYFRFGYADDTLKVAKIDTENGTMTTELPHLYGFKKVGLSQWYAINLIEEIDVPGEYCVDRKSGLLLFMPPEGFNKKSQIQLSMLKEVMVALEGCSNVRFENMTFENSRGSAVYIENGDSNWIAGCTFRNLGTLAIQIGKGIEPYPYGLHDGCGFRADGKDGTPASRIMGSWHEYIYRNTTWNRECGTNHRIVSCDIYNIGAGGVMLGGGDRKTLTPANNSVENCDISRVNRLDLTYKAPVNVDGVGNRIVNNHIHHTEGMGIYLHGNDHLIEFNEINDVLLDMSDQGSIYSGKDPSECGTMIRYNFFHHIDLPEKHVGHHTNQAIHFDDGGTHTASVIGNVFYKAGKGRIIAFNGGGEVPIMNNIAVDCPKWIYKSKSTSTEKLVNRMHKDGLFRTRLEKSIDITLPPYSEKYPVMLAIYNGEKELEHPFERNYTANGDYFQFVDALNMNFNLKKDSSVYMDIPGFEPIPFDKIGLVMDEFRTSVKRSRGRCIPFKSVHGKRSCLSMCLKYSTASVRQNLKMLKKRNRAWNEKSGN